MTESEDILRLDILHMSMLCFNLRMTMMTFSLPGLLSMLNIFRLEMLVRMTLPARETASTRMVATRKAYLSVH